MTIPATPAKLNSGAWGARVAGHQVAVGDEVSIAAQSGKAWTATVSRIVWKGPDVTLVATGEVANSHPLSGRCKGCGRGIKDAPQHRAMGGYCGECAFDQFDM